MRARRFVAVVIVALVAFAAAAPLADAKPKPTERARIHALEKQLKRQRTYIVDLYNRVLALQVIVTATQRTAEVQKACLMASPAGTESALSTSSSFLFDPFAFLPVPMDVVTHRGPDWLAYVDPACVENHLVPVMTSALSP